MLTEKELYLKRSRKELKRLHKRERIRRSWESRDRGEMRKRLRQKQLAKMIEISRQNERLEQQTLVRAALQKSKETKGRGLVSRIVRFFGRGK